MRDWSASMDDTHYALGTVCGPHPFPTMVSYFQSLIGQESREQILELTGKLPDRIYACVGGGSNASGLFLPFLEDKGVELVGVEAGGHGIESGAHAVRFSSGHIGVAQGYKTYFLQNPEGQMMHTHSIAAGLDYVGVGPILSHLHDEGKVRFSSATDQEVIDAVRLLIRTEGLIPALESTHGLAGLLRESSEMDEEDIVLFNLSGRGDKDIFNIAEALDDPKWREFIHQKSNEYRRSSN